MTAILLSLLLSQAPTIEGDKTVVVGDSADLTVTNAGADVTSSVWLWQPRAPKTCKVTSTLSRAVGNRTAAKFALTVVLAYKDGHQTTVQDELEFVSGAEPVLPASLASASIIPMATPSPPDLCTEPIAWAQLVKTDHLAADCKALSAGLSQLSVACDSGLVAAEAQDRAWSYRQQIEKDVGAVFAVALGKDGFRSWSQFADSMSAAFDALEQIGYLETSEDYAVALADVSAALREVAETNEQ